AIAAASETAAVEGGHELVVAPGQVHQARQSFGGEVGDLLPGQAICTGDQHGIRRVRGPDRAGGDEALAAPGDGVQLRVGTRVAECPVGAIRAGDDAAAIADGNEQGTGPGDVAQGAVNDRDYWIPGVAIGAGQDGAILAYGD